MVIPYPGSPALSDANSAQPVACPTAMEVHGVHVHADPQQQQHFLGLLQEAERRHQETMVRALQAEGQVQQLRQVFQLWQRQLDVQRQEHQRLLQQQQIQQHVQNQMQLQVRRQMEMLHDSLLRQQTTHRSQQQQTQQQLEDVYTFRRLESFSCQQNMGDLQLQLFSLERSQRVERRHRQILQRQMERHSRRWVSRPRCQLDDCCPCECPEECPFNPCTPDDCGDAKGIPEGPDAEDCFLRDIRLGLISCSSCNECKSPRNTKRKRRMVKNFSESESELGYEADDEASIASDISGNSSSFKEERRLLLQEVRSLKNTQLVPRYKRIWKPFRCFQCGGADHLAKFCHNEPTTVL